MLEQIFEILTGLNVWSVSLRVLLAILFGGCIGFERGFHGRAAGLRTHILVCLGATTAAMIGVFAGWELGFTCDPLRVGAQVVSGIGFLGVGTIIVRNHSHVTGLTTAAGLWATASVGLAIGIGFYLAAFLTFIAILITITILIRVEKHSKSRDHSICYIELFESAKTKDFCKQALIYAESFEVVPAKSGIHDHIGLEFKTKTPKDCEALLSMSLDSGDVVIALPAQY